MNVAAFGKATLAVSGLGERYNPSHPEISTQAMITANDQIQASMKEVRDLEAALNTLVKARRKAFDKTPSYMTRIIGAVDASNIPAAKKVVLRTLGKKSPVLRTIRKRPCRCYRKLLHLTDELHHED